MSIVHYLPEMPENGATVYADNGKFSADRAIFRDGKFLGGGEFPVPQYEMHHATKWFNMSEYDAHHRNVPCYTVSFDRAESLEPSG